MSSAWGSHMHMQFIHTSVVWTWLAADCRLYYNQVMTLLHFASASCMQAPLVHASPLETHRKLIGKSSVNHREIIGNALGNQLNALEIITGSSVVHAPSASCMPCWCMCHKFMPIAKVYSSRWCQLRCWMRHVGVGTAKLHKSALVCVRRGVAHNPNFR